MLDRVVDASVIVKWIIPEDYTEDALRLRDDFLDGKISIHTPNIILLEAASALRKYYLKGFIDRDIVEKAFTLIVSSEIKLYEVDVEMILKSLKRMCLDYDITIYDAIYILLTLNLNTTMYTADDELLNNQKLQELKILKHIKEYAKTVA